MPSKTIDVDIDLYYFDDDEIIEYLIDRIQKKQIKELWIKDLKQALAVDRATVHTNLTLTDVQRLEIFNEHAGKYLPAELEDRLK